MFGNPEWFKTKTIGWGLTPIRWQGWAYSLAWVSVIGVPFVMFLMREQAAESITWLAVTVGALVYDVRDIRRKLQPAKTAEKARPIPATPEKDVLYIGDSQAGATSVATRNYSFKLK